MQQAFAHTYREWATCMDRFYFRGKRGTFLRSSPLYGLYDDDLKAVIQCFADIDTDERKEAHIRAERIKKDADLAVEALFMGTDNVWKTFFGACEAIVDDTKECGCGTVSCYCGK
jgi:hypothetical protein